MSVVNDIINQAINTANSKTYLADQYMVMAINNAKGGADITVPTITAPTVVDPRTYLPEGVGDAAANQAMFDATYRGLVDDLSKLFADFFGEYFPLRNGLTDKVADWLDRAVGEGGTGINPIVEQQIWQRERDRLARTKSEAQAGSVAAWAAKGFPLPPGAAAGAIHDLEVRYMQAVNDQARTIAENAFKAELENVRFAVQQALDMRTRALSAAADYLRTFTSATGPAVQMAMQNSDAKARLLSAAASFYSASTNAGELNVRADIANAGNVLQAHITKANTDVEYAGQRIKAMMAMAESVGQQAAAALNGLNATTQLIETLD